MVCFLHTADLQLGKGFREFPGDPGAVLRERRLAVIERMGAVVRERGCRFVVIAGDFFDAHTIGERTVRQACDCLHGLGVPVFILPGNHDASVGPESVYRRPSFIESAGSSIRVLHEPTPLPILEGEVLLLPAPLAHRFAAGDTTAHITEDFGREAAPGAIRIGVAHGSVVDFSADGGGAGTNLIDPRREAKGALDYLALGDWHGLKRVGERTWYSGTPEPTAFDENDPGHVIAVSIRRHGEPPEVEPVCVASTRWIRQEAVLHDEADLSRLERWFDALDAPRDTLVRLSLSGTLSFESLARLERLRERMAGRLLALRVRGRGVTPQPAEDELDAIAASGFVKRAVDLLRARAASDADEARRAARALQILYTMRSGGAPP